MKIKIVGIDPALSNCGFAIGEFDTNTNKYDIKKIKLIQTEPTKSKQLRKSSDDIARSQKVAKEFYESTKDAHFVFVEIPTGAQSARAAFSFGVVTGIVAAASVSPSTKWRLIQLTPTEVKQAIPDGSRNTAKQEIMEWAEKTFPNVGWEKRGGKLINKMEHPADACAIINAGVRHDDFLNSMTILSNLGGENDL